MAKDIFERLSAGRPPQEPTPPADSPGSGEAARLAAKHLDKPIIRVRDIRIYGPHSLRDRESAIKTAEILVNSTAGSSP